MTWLVILDNGEEYSSHAHIPVLSCATEADALAAKAVWDAWFSTIPRSITYKQATYDYLDMNWITANPPPFAIQETRNLLDTDRAHLWIIEVPEWAKT